MALPPPDLVVEGLVVDIDVALLVVVLNIGLDVVGAVVADPPIPTHT